MYLFVVVGTFVRVRISVVDGGWGGGGTTTYMYTYGSLAPSGKHAEA